MAPVHALKYRPCAKLSQYITIFSCIVFVPVDVVKERLQVQIQSSSQTPNSKIYASNINGTLPQYTGSLDACKQICQQEGLRGIYRGYGATLMSYGPFSALYFFLYEEVMALVDT